jgi:hypothetical protein
VRAWWLIWKKKDNQNHTNGEGGKEERTPDLEGTKTKTKNDRRARLKKKPHRVSGGGDATCTTE